MTTDKKLKEDFLEIMFDHVTKFLGGEEVILSKYCKKVMIFISMTNLRHYPAISWESDNHLGLIQIQI